MSGDILTPRELRRYSKQIMIPEIGVQGQEKLKKASVMVIGAGGLGCSVLQYLTAAGIGNIGITEYDLVDETNLQRQILFNSDDAGKLKSVIVKKRLEELNSLVSVEVFNLKLTGDNAENILKNYDIIVDASDNYETRYVISDSCAALDKPMVHGAIYKSEGQVSVFNYKGSPDYRSYNPTTLKSDHKNPEPAETGLFGVLAGISGSIMANEVIKIITGTGTLLCGKILCFNMADHTFRTMKLI